MPRSAILMLIGCVVLALLVNVWLALLAVVSGVLLWQLFQRLRGSDDNSELADWEVPRISSSEWQNWWDKRRCLARLQSQGLAERAYDNELDALYRRHEPVKTPAMRTNLAHCCFLLDLRSPSQS